MKARMFTEGESRSLEVRTSNDRPISEIFRDIVNHLSEIVRSEIRLASLEAKQKIAELKTAAMAVVFGSVLIMFGGIFLLLGGVYALSTIWPPWLAAVVVGAGVGIIGGVILQSGIGKFRHPTSK